MCGAEQPNDGVTAVTRRTALGGSVAIASAMMLVDADPAAAAGVAAAPTGPTIDIVPVVNGRATPVSIDPRTSLLDMLRERLALTGAKKGCDHGQCGACTVHLDGHRIASCLTLAVKTDGRKVTTIEGLADGDRLHPMQQAFIDHDALQCGYCTPGQIMAAVACIREGNATSRPVIREYMSGNICRCGAYVGIVAAIEAVAAQGRS
ncbi:(2Fe-2S)-binding protein [Sphingomonas sp. UV9]|uniref:(2Fe-2S)-binding protein n=1 Tax=Sphingomonas sp. UV9 TaxID=1851410 RepID=UPI000FFCBA20|nr:(2Fe-2S)-binding protein [Sphingomonas sp. UV9]RXD05609.1 (2Fe-2S)-binding protein [Sphingomonas sp. UV9]